MKDERRTSTTAAAASMHNTKKEGIVVPVAHQVDHQEDPGASQERDQEDPKHTEGHRDQREKRTKKSGFGFRQKIPGCKIPLFGPGWGGGRGI